MPALPHIFCSADLHEQEACGINDAIDELAELAGVDLNSSSSSAAPDSEEQDPDTQQELRRLLDHLHDPVMPGAQYTTLQVNTRLHRRGCWRNWWLVTTVAVVAAAMAIAAVLWPGGALYCY